MSVLQEKFCQRLRTLRTERGYSQENMAEMLSMSVGGYSKIERGETEVSLTRVEQIAMVLKTEVGQLLEITNNYYFNNTGTGNFGYSSSGVVNIQMDKEFIHKLLDKIVLNETPAKEIVKKVKRGV